MLLLQQQQLQQRHVKILDMNVPARDAAAGDAGHEQMRAAGALARSRRSPCTAWLEGEGGGG